MRDREWMVKLKTSSVVGRIAGTAIELASVTICWDNFFMGTLLFGFFSWAISIEIAMIILPVVLIHEFGHALTCMWFGMRVKRIRLTSFGGVTEIGRSGRNFFAHSIVSIAGPLTGLTTALIAIMMWQLTSNNFWVTVASWGVFINLFNLLPFRGLDGEKIVRMVIWSARKKEKAALVFSFFFAATAAVSFILRQDILSLALAYVAFTPKEISLSLNHEQKDPRHRRRYKRKPPISRDDPAMTQKQVTALAAMYTSSVALCVVFLAVFKIIGGS